MVQLSKVHEVAMARLNEHMAAKHPKASLADCFPDWTPEALAAAQAAAASKPKQPEYKPDKVAGVK